MRSVIRSLLLEGGWDPSKIPFATEWHDWQTQPGGHGDAVASTTGKMLGLQFVQAVGTAKPTIDDAGINGHRCISLSTDDFMTCDALSAYTTGNDLPYTIFGVAQMDDLGASTSYLESAGNTGDATKVDAFRKDSTIATVSMLRRGTSDAANVQASSAALIGSLPFAFVRAFTGTAVTLYIGTSMTKLIDNGALNAGSMALNTVAIGCLRRTTNANFMNGKWGERVFKAAYETDLTVIQNFMKYAARRWGTP